MPRVGVGITNFTSGELTQRARARIDLSRYYNGAQLLQNVIVHPIGGATKRQGTHYVGPCADSDKVSRLVEFEYSQSEVFVLEFGDSKLRFNKNRAPLVAEHSLPIANGTFDSDIASWSDASFGGGSLSWDSTNARALFTQGTTAGCAMSQTISGLDASDRDLEIVLRFDILTESMSPYMVMGNGKLVGVNVKVTDDQSNELLGANGINFSAGHHCVPFTITDALATAVTITFRTPTISAVVTADLPAQGSALWGIDNVNTCGIGFNGGADLDQRWVEITTPFPEAELFRLRFKQSADALYIVHPDHQPMKLVRYSDTRWSLIRAPLLDGPWLDDGDKPSVGYYPGLGVTTNPGATSGHNVQISGSSFFDTAGGADVGRLYRFKASSAYGWAILTKIKNTGQADADIIRNFDGTGATVNWAMGAFSPFTGYPAGMGFFESRFGFVGTPWQPQTAWLSASAGFEDFEPGSNDDDPITATLANGQQNLLHWIEGSSDLLVGSVGREWKISGAGSALTPTNIAARPQTSYGSDPSVQPLLVASAVLFVQRSGRKLRELTYIFERDAYDAPDLLQLAEHLTHASNGGKIVQMAYQREPVSTIWCVTENGWLLSLTYERPQEVVAWTRHTTGAGGIFESVAVIPSTGEGDYEVWVTVKRTIDGGTVRYVERFDTGQFPDREDDWYVDAGGQYDGVATTSITGADHLEGETVAILVDGGVHPPKVVDGGAFELDYEGEKVNYGLDFRPKIETMPLSIVNSQVLANQKSWGRIGAMLYESADVLINGNSVYNRAAEDEVNTPAPLLTGLRYVPDEGWSEEAPITLEQQDYSPTPWTVLGIFGNVEVSEE